METDSCRPWTALLVISGLNNGEGESADGGEAEAAAPHQPAAADRYWALLGLGELDDDEADDTTADQEPANPYWWLDA